MLTNPSKIKAVLFDFDGTLTRPGAIDFEIMRTELNCPEGMPVLEFIAGLPTAKQRDRARRKLDQFEIEAARASRPHDGAEALVTRLYAHGLPTGIITRNSRPCLTRAMQNFSRIVLADFDVVLTRDDPVKPKPAGDGIIWAAQKWGLDTACLLMVGDFIFDIQAGREAGAQTVLLDNGHPSPFPIMEGDFTIQHLSELETILGLS